MKRLLIPLGMLVAAHSTVAPVPAGGPPRAPAVGRSPASAPSGAYKLDPRHASVIARMQHGGGTSFSTFRFNGAAGTLAWNGADPAASQVSVTIDMTSIDTPVAGFAAELIGDKFLKTAQFHDATFQSTAISVTGPTTGRISGNLTFMGQTRPATIEAALVGAGSGRDGPVVGFSGTLRFKRSAFGFSSMAGAIGDDIEILIDTEFDKAA